PENYPLAIAYIDTLTMAKQLGAARKITQQTIALRNNEPRLYRMLSKIEELDNNQVESHRMLAEAFVANGELRPAVQQLEIALNTAGKSNFYQTSKIESRLNKLRDLLKAQEKADKR
ncbi:MAG: hypothetical protein KZQ86_03640, partial [Candidatus Thiodiazotropha sp. (ex Lucinoma kastoroae)]|nr:hypothetical protein [Candidatus Thiodiazotropha sp. (ex Lucinoma kastoroae)]